MNISSEGRKDQMEMAQFEVRGQRSVVRQAPGVAAAAAAAGNLKVVVAFQRQRPR